MTPAEKLEHLERIRHIKTPKRADASRANANKPPKPGKMARGRPRKQSDLLGGLGAMQSAGATDASEFLTLAKAGEEDNRPRKVKDESNEA